MLLLQKPVYTRPYFLEQILSGKVTMKIVAGQQAILSLWGEALESLQYVTGHRLEVTEAYT